MIRAAAPCAALLLLLLAGCGSGSKSAGCKDVPLGMNNEVSSSLATGFSVDDFQAVKSEDQDVWFVSAKATGPSGQVTYPTWITKDVGGGPVYIGDNDSHNVTPGLAKLSNVSTEEDAAAKARDCARDAAESGS